MTMYLLKCLLLPVLTAISGYVFSSKLRAAEDLQRGLQENVLLVHGKGLLLEVVAETIARYDGVEFPMCQAFTTSNTLIYHLLAVASPEPSQSPHAAIRTLLGERVYQALERLLPPEAVKEAAVQLHEDDPPLSPVACMKHLRKREQQAQALLLPREGEVHQLLWQQVVPQLTVKETGRFDDEFSQLGYALIAGPLLRGRLRGLFAEAQDGLEEISPLEDFYAQKLAEGTPPEAPGAALAKRIPQFLRIWNNWTYQLSAVEKHAELDVRERAKQQVLQSMDVQLQSMNLAPGERPIVRLMTRVLPLDMIRHYPEPMLREKWNEALAGGR